MAFIKLPTYGMLLLCQIANFPRHTSEFYKLLQQEHFILLWLKSGKSWRVTGNYLSWLEQAKAVDLIPAWAIYLKSLTQWSLEVPSNSEYSVILYCYRLEFTWNRKPSQKNSFLHICINRKDRSSNPAKPLCWLFRSHTYNQTKLNEICTWTKLRKGKHYQNLGYKAIIHWTLLLIIFLLWTC